MESKIYNYDKHKCFHIYMEYIYSRWTISKIAAVIFAYVGKLKIDYVSRPDMGSRGDTRADMEKVMY